MNILETLLFTGFVSLSCTLFWYEGRREKIEISGMDETPFQSFYREFMSNYLILLPVMLVVVVLDFLIGLI